MFTDSVGCHCPPLPPSTHCPVPCPPVPHPRVPLLTGPPIPRPLIYLPTCPPADLSACSPAHLLPPRPLRSPSSPLTPFHAVVASATWPLALSAVCHLPPLTWAWLLGIRGVLAMKQAALPRGKLLGQEVAASTLPNSCPKETSFLLLHRRRCSVPHGLVTRPPTQQGAPGQPWSAVPPLSMACGLCVPPRAVWG